MGEFKQVHPKCNQDMSDQQNIFQIKLANADYYFAPADPNDYRSTQKWIDEIKNLKSGPRHKLYRKLHGNGYRSVHIGTALDQYEMAYDDDDDDEYAYREVKAMVDRLAKPDNEYSSTSETSVSKKSASSTSPNNGMMHLELNALEEEKSCHAWDEESKVHKEINVKKER